MKSSVAVALVLVLGCAAPGPPGSGVAAVSSALEQPASQPGSQPASQPSSQPTTPPNCQYWECTQCAGGQHRVRAVGTTPGEGQQCPFTCPVGQIVTDVAASYGYWSTYNPGAGLECHPEEQPPLLEATYYSCGEYDEQNTCTARFDNRFGDPWPGCIKNGHVSWNCDPDGCDPSIHFYLSTCGSEGRNFLITVGDQEFSPQGVGNGRPYLANESNEVVLNPINAFHYEIYSTPCGDRSGGKNCEEVNPGDEPVHLTIPRGQTLYVEDGPCRN